MPGCLTHALCGHTVDTAAGSRPLADLGEIDPDCRCDPCEQIHRGAAGRSLNEDWHKEALDQTGADPQPIDPGPW